MADLGTNNIIIQKRWSDLKAVVDAHTLFVRYDDEDGRYQIYAIDGPLTYAAWIWKTTVPSGVIDGGYSQAQNDLDLAEFEASYKSTANQKQVATTSDGQQQVSVYPTKGTRNTVFTFNWCDKTTWYQDAVRVVDETATDSGDHLTFTLAHQNVIDTYHGKLSSEDYLVDSNSNSYRVVVKVDGTTKTEQDPHYGTGGDYTIDYAAGEITFASSQEGNTVTVTYHYAQSSLFMLVPPADKDYEIVRVEVQFTKDVVINDSVRFQMTGPFGPGGAYVPVSQPTVYKTMVDFLNDCDGNYPMLPAFSVSSWRGLPQDMLTIPWNYAAIIEVIGSYGLRVEVMLDHDEPFGGTSATATFYCLVHDNDH